jgi:SIR2-like domain
MRSELEELACVIGSGEARLFTGAGFSAGARDIEGNTLPDSAQMSRELWPLVFDSGDEPDNSSLPDLYDAALLRAPERLRAYVATRLHIGDHELPDHYAAWFSAPWRRIYTLNVDDLERAVARQFQLPRPLRSISAICREPRPAAPDELDVVHLNGIAGDAADELTFSTMQYASRLCSRDREYERLVMDLERAPFVFVGTTLDEVVLWQHVELHRRANGEAPRRPPSFLISTSLTRARQVLLESLGIRWIRSTIEALADELWSDPRTRIPPELPVRS